MSIWDDFCDPLLAQHQPLAGRAMRYPTPDEIVPRLAALTAEDIDWFTRALDHGMRKWVAASLLSDALMVPEVLFAPLLRAAVYEPDPSFNRAFVEPCLHSFGHRRVNEVLLDTVAHGSNFEKAGAINALYWAQVGLTFHGRPPAWTSEYATPESRAAYEALTDIWLRKRCLLLREFVTNPSVEVRRSSIPHLPLDPSIYPDDVKPLVAEAIQIARNHPDDYIRHRVEVQLGNEQLLRPIPHRDEPQDPTAQSGTGRRPSGDGCG